MLRNEIAAGQKPQGMTTERQKDDHSADLVRVAQERDKAAFKRLFVHFAPRVKAVMMRGGLEVTQAEELMQEAMVSVWRKAHLFDPCKARASTWIFTIARNLKIDRFRKQARAEVDLDDPALVPDPLSAADDLVQQGQDRRRIEKAITGLTPEQMQVVDLCFYKDLSHSQIAAQLEIPIGTVKSRIRLAVGKLRASLENA